MVQVFWMVRRGGAYHDFRISVCFTGKLIRKRKETKQSMKVKWSAAAVGICSIFYYYLMIRYFGDSIKEKKISDLETFR